MKCVCQRQSKNVVVIAPADWYTWAITEKK